MKDLKDGIETLIEEYFSTKTCGFDFRGDTQMEDYIRGIVRDLVTKLTDELEDTDKQIDDELELWEAEHGPEYYQRQRNTAEWLATRML